MRKINRIIRLGFYFLLTYAFLDQTAIVNAYVESDFNATPPFVTSGAAPLVMLVMGRDHKLYYPAYNDASDLDGDGVLDTQYKPSIEYYGYFDSYKYYQYVATYSPPNASDMKGRFIPVGAMGDDKKVPAALQSLHLYWSGNFLNYLTMARIDVMRRVLYGGYRTVDSTTDTVLERAYITNDSHCWGKDYLVPANYTPSQVATLNGYDIAEVSQFSIPASSASVKNILFATGSLVAPGTANYAPLLRVKLNSTQRASDWVNVESGTGIMSDGVIGNGVYSPDFAVRVQVGVVSATIPQDNNEKVYTDTSTGATVVKPVGLLQRYGESGNMMFGLMTGSYQNNLKGGVLRKNIGSITDEIVSSTGQFKYKLTSGGITFGIIKTIDAFQITGFDHGSHLWYQTNTDETPIYSRPINNGEFWMWGNPIGEMMYETLRYFAGNGNQATPAFSTGITNNNDRGVSLPLEATWKDPYKLTGTNAGGFPSCAKPFILVISDINPSYDTDQVPGADPAFKDSTFTNTFSPNGNSFDAASLANTIFTSGEQISTSLNYIGDSTANTPQYDTACTAK